MYSFKIILYIVLYLSKVLFKKKDILKKLN